MFSLRFLPSVCEQSINRLWRHRCTASVNLFARYNCFNRNVFDSCVKSWEYFRSDSILLETSYSWLSDDVVRLKSKWGLWRNVQKCQHRFRWIFRTRHIMPSLSMTSLSLAGVYCASRLLGRCLCKRIDVYIITLSCTWRIYALSECLLVCICGTSHGPSASAELLVLLDEGFICYCKYITTPQKPAADYCYDDCWTDETCSRRKPDTQKD